MGRINTEHSLMTGIKVRSAAIKATLPGVREEERPPAVFYSVPIGRFNIEITKLLRGYIAVVHIVGPKRGRYTALNNVLSRLGATEIDASYAEERIERRLLGRSYMQSD